MLDVIRALITEALELSTEEVNQANDTLLAERASADGRYAAKSALEHPEGSTTPINETCRRAQKRYAHLRKQAEKALPKVMAGLLALEIAKQRRDEALTHRDHRREDDADYIATGVKTDTRDWMGRLVRHGVYPNHLKAQTDENVAIVADMLAWKAKDPKYKDQDNPWRAVLGVYAGRRIEKPGRAGKAVRSVSGTPTRNRHIADLGDYMFNEMIKPDWAPAAANSAAPDAVEAGPASTTFDCSTYLNEAERLVLDVHPKATPTAVVAPPVTASDDAGNVASEADELGSTVPGGPPARSIEAVALAAIDPEQARLIAETIFATNPIKMAIYWPRGWGDQNDFEPTRLIAALEAWVAKGKVWTGGMQFFAAAKQGKAREFIADRRRAGISALASRIIDREESTWEQAKEAGFELPS